MAEQEAPRRPEAPVSALKSARDLPHNVEAEQAVLGAVLIDENAFDQVAALLKPGDFYLLPHQHVFDVCMGLATEGKTIDPVLVTQRLDAKGLLGTAVPSHPFASSRWATSTGSIVFPSVASPVQMSKTCWCGSR